MNMIWNHQMNFGAHFQRDLHILHGCWWPAIRARVDWQKFAKSSLTCLWRLSTNGGPPKSSISMGIPIINHPFLGILGYPIYGNHKIIIILVAFIPRVWRDEQIQFTHCLTNAACQKNAVAPSTTTLCLRNSIEIPIFDPVIRATRLVFQPGIPHLHLEVVTRASLPWLLLFAAGFSAVKPPEKHKVRGSCLV